MQPRTTSKKSLDVSWLFVLLGVGGLGLALVHVSLDVDALWSEVLDAFILVGLSFVVFYEAREVRRAAFAPRKGLWVFLGTLSAGIGVALLAASYIIVRNVTGSPLGEDWYIVFAGWLVGVTVGAPAFIYYGQLETELEESRELNKQLRVSQRALRHNLRNELSVIIGHVDDLTTDPVDSENDERLRIVRRHLDQLVSLSQHAQSLAAVWETDAIQTFGLETTVVTAADSVRERYPECEVTVAVPTGLSVRAHERFRLAVTETIDNAVQHSPPGTAVTVSATGEGERVHLVVADAGHGIPDLDVQALSQHSETPLAHARGLGLWVIYWVTEKSKGTVAFEPNEPRGTRVVLTLPTA